MIFLNPPPSWAEEEDWIMSVQKEELSPFKHRNGYGPGGINVDLTFKDYPINVAVRLHKSLAHRLSDVNKAVAKLRENGRVRAIIQRNIR